jgi:hypothetical protein
MGCEHKESGGFYHPRQPRQTPFYQLIERFYPQFEASFKEIRIGALALDLVKRCGWLEASALAA